MGEQLDAQWQERHDASCRSPADMPAAEVSPQTPPNPFSYHPVGARDRSQPGTKWCLWEVSCIRQLHRAVSACQRTVHRVLFNVLGAETLIDNANLLCNRC